MELYDVNTSVDTDNILIYGAPGTGKTHTALTAGRHLYTLVLDVDWGAKTLKNLPEEIQNNVVVLRYTQFSDLNDIYQMLLKNNTPEKWEVFFKQKGIKFKPKKAFECIVIDSLSELQRKMQLELQDIAVTKKLDNPSNIRALKIQEWGAVADLTATTCSDAFGMLPIVFIATAHEQMIVDEVSGMTAGTPLLSGKIAFNIGKYFDLMGRMAMTRDGQYAMLLKPERKWQAKTRGNLPDIMLNPTIGKLTGLEPVDNK